MSRKAGVIMSYILMIFEVLSTLLITPYLIRDLGQAEYGVYKLVAAITAYLLFAYSNNYSCYRNCLNNDFSKSFWKRVKYK